MTQVDFSREDAAVTAMLFVVCLTWQEAEGFGV